MYLNAKTTQLNRATKQWVTFKVKDRVNGRPLNGATWVLRIGNQADQKARGSVVKFELKSNNAYNVEIYNSGYYSADPNYIVAPFSNVYGFSLVPYSSKKNKPLSEYGLGSYLSAATGEKTGFLSFSQASVVGDISFLLLCGVGVMLIAPSLPMLGQKIKGIIGGSQS